MRIGVRVVARAKRNDVRREGAGYKVYLTQAPVDGKANKALLDLLAGYLGTKKSQLSIVSGLKSRDKVIEWRK